MQIEHRRVRFDTGPKTQRLAGHQPAPGAIFLERGQVTDTVMREGGVGLLVCRSEEHTSELQSLMRISYAVFCLKKKNKQQKDDHNKRKNTSDIYKAEDNTS